jgi:integrase
MKYRFARKEKRLAFGVYPEVSLKKARMKRTEARELLGSGTDPGEAKRLAKLKVQALAQDSFGAIAREWFDKQRPHWSKSHADRVKRALTKDLSSLATRPIAQISPIELLTALRKVEARGAIETAHRTKQVAGQVFRYAVATARADRDQSRDLQGALSKPKKYHLPAIIKPDDVGGLLRAIRGYEGTPVVRAALQLAPLVFVRPGELRHFEWSELDLDNSLWIIPGSKMKTGNDHFVPLSVQAEAIITDVRPLTGRFRYVFPSARSPRRPMSDNAVLAAFRRMGIPKEQMSGHGFRAMARTLLAEELEYPAHLIEHQLAHAVKDANGQAYNRTSFIKQRADMMQHWADYLDGLADR